MAQGNKANLRPVRANIEEMEAEIKRHRVSIFKRTVIIIGIIVILASLTGLWLSLRKYDGYDVVNTTEMNVSSNTKLEDFRGLMISYSNDGIASRDSMMNLIWNQSYEMNNPQVDTAGKYLTAFDKGGSSLYIVETAGVVKRIDTVSPIQKACIAEQGTVAVLMKEGETSYIKLYDKSGKELAGGEFYGEKGSFPIDIAFSPDAQKLAIAFVDVTSGKMKSTISFYNFGTVGQNEIDNNVGTYSYSDTVIASMKYVADNRMIAFSDKAILIYEGSQKPSLARQIDLDHEVQSVFWDSKYIGITYTNDSEELGYHICVYGMLGNIIMEEDTNLPYNQIEFLDGHEVCLRNSNACEIYTIHGVKKFHYTFDEEIYKIFSKTGSKDYIFISKGKAEEVRLK